MTGTSRWYLAKGHDDRDYVGSRTAGPLTSVQRSSARNRGELTGFVMPRDGWPLRGACVVPTGAPDAVEMFDAFDEPTTSPERLAMVRGICAGCPVLAECRDFGAGQRYGFFGGLTPEERAAHAVGDERPHEQLAAEAAQLERARSSGLVERPAHGGTRRGSSWEQTRASQVAASLDEVEEA